MDNGKQERRSPDGGKDGEEDASSDVPEHGRAPPPPAYYSSRKVTRRGEWSGGMSCSPAGGGGLLFVIAVKGRFPCFVLDHGAPPRRPGPMPIHANDIPTSWRRSSRKPLGPRADPFLLGHPV